MLKDFIIYTDKERSHYGGHYTVHADHFQEDQQVSGEVQHTNCAYSNYKECSPVGTSER
jgi:hypothetical protein